MRKLIIVICMLLSVNIFSQDISRNIIFAEASGVTGIYSVNYERLLFKNQNVNLGIRGGFAYVPVFLGYESRMQFPISLSLIKNITKNHFLEMRVGLSNSFYIYEDWYGRPLGDTTNTFVPTKKLGMGIIPSIGIGYRYQPETKGVFFNLLAQRIPYYSDKYWYENFSLGLGYAF
jgi:hypothetical protein